MSILEWKKFNFFRLIPYADQRKIKDCLKAKVSAYISNSVYKIFCDALGYVHIFFRSWESISFYANNSAIYLCAHLSETNFLITLSNADCIGGIILKVWDLNKLTKRNGAPCIGTAVISSQYNASALDISYQNSYSCIAVGFESGEICVFRGQINRDFSVGFRTFQASTSRISGIKFKQKNSKCLTMFVSSDAGVFCYVVTENNEVKETRFVLDAKIVPIPCCALQTTGSATDPYFIVGRSDAIYCYTSDGRGPCYAIEGEKKCIAWFANYIVIVIHPNNSSFVTQSENIIIIIDISHKMIVLNKSIESITGILIDNKACFVLTDANDMYAVFEKDTNTKMELLINKQLYDIALRLINHENCEEKRIAHIYKRYGDHLYLKGDFGGAVEKYINTIGVLEPYCIIGQFLGSKLVRYLSEYLNSLLKTKFATEEHVELYINCNSRMNLPVKLDEFLCDNDIDEEGGTFKEIFCNINETMMSKSVMRQSGTNLQHQIFDTSLSRLLRIINNSDDVEKFFYQLSENEIYRFFKEHGQTLTKYYARQTTDILKLICVKEKIVTCPEYFIPLLSNQPLYCVNFLEHIIHNCIDCNPIVYNFLFELYLRRWKCNETDSEVLCRFLECYDKYYSKDEILIKCKNYSYWDGILYFYKNKQFHNLSVRFYIQNSDLGNVYNFFQSNNELYSKFWNQPLRDIEFVSESSISLLQYILTENSKKQLQSPLQILQIISEMKTSLLVHVKEFYLQEHLRCTKELENQSKTVFNLNSHLQQLNILLKNYSLKPIEVRSNVCDICKQQLNYPAVYFLCQHTFHKHCLSLYSDADQYCNACEANKDKYTDKPSEFSEESFLSQLRLSEDFIELIERCLQKRVFNEKIYVNQYINNTVICSKPKNVNDSALGTQLNDVSSKSTPLNDNPKTKHSNNPFETNDGFVSTNPLDHYDANLNPFEE